MKPEYVLIKYKHGWLVNGPEGREGHVPVNALPELMGMFKDSMYIYPGIAKHYHVVLALATIKEAGEWESEITKSLTACPPQDQWIHGVDTGISSCSIFHVLCDGRLRGYAHDYCRGGFDIPHDAADFGRCVRLISKFPEWRLRLPEVADAYPNTKWPEIIYRWDELEKATPKEQTEAFRKMLS